MLLSVSLLVFIIVYLYPVGPGTITYQGTVITSGGSTPPDGNYAMLFSLWNLQSGGSSATNRLWYETYTDANAVTVTKGAFSVELGSITTFPTQLFMNNPNLWLQVSVDLTGVTGSVLQIYSPRVTFSATPYAFHSDNAHTLDGFGRGAFAMLDAVNMFAASPTGSSYTDAPVKIYPELGFNPNDPLFSIYTSSNNMILAREPGNLLVSGVFQAGTIQDFVAYNRIGDGTATFAYVASSNDLLINGDLEVKGYITWGAIKTNSYSINSIDFNPYRNTYNYYCSSASLFKAAGDTNAQSWYAPVHIPDDAEVTVLSVWYYDNTGLGDITVALNRKPIGTISPTTMASVASSGTPGAGSGTDSTITNAVISNSNYVYCVTVIFPSANTGNTLQLRSVRITYHTTGP